MTARKQIIYWGKKALLFVLSVLVLSLAAFYVSRLAPRSEERRVGKECAA